MELRLFVFHHAGGSHLMYRDWPERFPADWEVRTPDAPGRGPMDGRPPAADAAALVDHFLDELAAELTGRFALFGHSMGAVVAYELTRRLIAEGRTPPVWLGLSSRGAPGGQTTHRHLLSDADLRGALAAMGGTPAAVLEHPELWELFAPVIRGDLRLVETWRPGPVAEPLPVPMSVFGGTRDELVPPGRLADWSGVAGHFLGRHLFDGDHFYFRDHLTALAGQITDDVRKALALAEDFRTVPR
ncbi:thioesterase II family protein [Streptomyces sp. NPDC057445]|uniref:thioesterase II family protein n=1 Tax=Streptomyces sp. NPDC057445 TaxID=3346136 RepID=UPI0036D02650